MGTSASRMRRWKGWGGGWEEGGHSCGKKEKGYERRTRRKKEKGEERLSGWTGPKRGPRCKFGGALADASKLEGQRTPNLKVYIYINNKMQNSQQHINIQQIVTKKKILTSKSPSQTHGHECFKKEKKVKEEPRRRMRRGHSHGHDERERGFERRTKGKRKRRGQEWLSSWAGLRRESCCFKAWEASTPPPHDVCEVTYTTK